jgi:hypothetical protein
LDGISDGIKNWTHLEGANLAEAKGITNEELHRQATFLRAVTMPNSQRYEDWFENKDREENGKNGGSP